MATDLGIRVTGDLGTDRIHPLLAIISRMSDPMTTPPGSWTSGAGVMPDLAGRHQITWRHEEGNGVSSKRDLKALLTVIAACGCSEA